MKVSAPPHCDVVATLASNCCTVTPSSSEPTPQSQQRHLAVQLRRTELSRDGAPRCNIQDASKWGSLLPDRVAEEHFDELRRFVTFQSSFEAGFFLLRPQNESAENCGWNGKK